MANNRYLDAFMRQFPFEGLTYDDVTLVTQYADFLPDDASLETRLTSRQTMKIPFMSAAMDTVTEAPMAIAMALAGGIGVIHKNLEEDDQAKQVAKVKSYLNGLIAKPVCFHANDDISFLRAEKRQRGYKFNGFPVLDDQERLVGMITGSDMRFAPLDAAKLADVMQKNPITARPGTSGRLFQALGQQGLNIRLIAQGADELSIIVGVQNSDFENAIRVLYDGFAG